PEAVAHKAERHAAERGHRQGESERQRRLSIAKMQIARDWHEQKRIEDQIIEIETPGGKTKPDNPIVNLTERLLTQKRRRGACDFIGLRGGVGHNGRTGWPSGQ